MKRILIVFIFFSLFIHAQTSRDSSKIAFSLFAKTGLIYDYPFYQNYSDIGPMGEIGVNMWIDRTQITSGIGVFPNNSHWNSGADQFNPAKRGTTSTTCLYFPLHANFRLFNLKKNYLSVKAGFIFLISTQARVNEIFMYSTYEDSNSYNVMIPLFGMAGCVGFKYSRQFGERIFVGAELGLNMAIVPSHVFGTNYTYSINMINRHPNGDFKIFFEYKLGRKKHKYFDETRKKAKKPKEDVMDEE